MIRVVFAHDVEDVYNPASDDALLELCRICSEEEVPVSMFMGADPEVEGDRAGLRHQVCLPLDGLTGMGVRDQQAAVLPLLRLASVAEACVLVAPTPRS